MWKFYLLHNSLLKSHYKHEKSVENDLNAFFMPYQIITKQEAPIMISKMNKTTSNANPPPKSPSEPDMKYPPFA